MITLSAAPTDPMARDGDATRSALLRAAARRFTLFGFDRTTCADIARDADVDVDRIAWHFGSKEGLFDAVSSHSTFALAEETTRDVNDLVDAIRDGMRVATGNDVDGVHPLLLMVDDCVENERVGVLRGRALRVAVDHLASLTSAPGTQEPERGWNLETRLRGETALAMLVGLLAVRAAVPDSALSEASSDHIDALVRDLVDAL